MDIKDHTFLVSGGSSGLGAACVRMLAKAGGNVAIADVNRASGEELTARMIYVRAPAPAVQGGKVHPTVYLVYVQGEHLLRAIYSSDVIEKAEPHRNTGS